MAGGEPPKIKTPLGLIWLDDGIAQVEIVKKALTVKDVEGHTSVVLELSQSQGPVSMPVIVDLGALERADGEALRATAVMLRPEWNEKVAFLVRNPLQKILASFLMGTGRIDTPAGIFESRNEAIVWLKSRSRKAPQIGKDAQSKDRIQGIVDALANTLLTGKRMNIPVTRRDKTDALAAGLALLSEAFRASSSGTAAGSSADARHVAELERMIEERTREIKEVNAKLSEEIEGKAIKEKELEESERKYRTLADTLPQVVFEIDLKGLFSYVNEAGFELFGYTRDDLDAGTSALDMIDESDHERVAGAMRKMIDGSSTGAVREYLLKTKDGRTFPARVYTTLITDEAGRPEGIRGILTDITSEKKAEKAREDWERTFANVGEGLFILDGDYRVVQCNRAFEEFLGKESSEIVGRHCFELMHGEDSPPAFCVVGQSLAKREKASGEIWEPSVGKYLEVTADPILNEKGELESAIHVVRDISERKLAELALRESEQRFRQIFHESTIGKELYDADGQLIDANRTTLEIFGVPSFEEVKGFRLFEDPNITDDVKESLTRGESAHYVSEFDFERVKELNLYRTSRSGTIFLDVLITPLTSIDSRAVTGYIVHIRDITEQKLARDALDENLRFLQNLIDAMPNPVFVKDTEGVYTGSNRAFAEYMGRPREEIVGKTVFDMAPRDLARVYKEKDDELLQNPGVQVYEAQVTDASGVRRDVIFNKATFSRLDGSLAGLVGVILDITERKRAENDLRRVNAELDGFAHTVSHDLKSSLTAISVGSQTLQELIDGPMTDEVRQDIHVTTDVITRGVQGAAVLIEDLLALAEAGQKPSDIQEVGVRGVVERVLEEQRREIEGRGIEVECDENLGRVYASPAHVYQLFMNIIRNAIKHNDSPSPRIVIRFLGESSGRKSYKICDNGSGVPPDTARNIFLPFYKGETGGAGIGLSTVEKIVEVYGGSIKVFNEGGACFEFSLGDYRDPA